MITKDDAEYIFEQLAFNKKTYKDLSNEYHLHPSTLCKQMKIFKKDFNLNDDEKYCAKTYLKYKYKDDIIEKYKSGKSTKTIALEYDLSDDHLIATLLRELGIEIRSVGYQSRTNQSLFEDINSEIEAYALGLITADGSVSKAYSVSITLHKNDKYLLENINQRLCDNTGYLFDETNKETCRLIFNGKQICENLKKYGVVQRKSYIIKSIYYFNDPILMQHYLRGLFDGDGVCSKNNQYLRLGYCAYNKEFTKSYQDFLCNTLQIRKNKLFNTGNTWQCSWGAKKDIEKLYQYLYKNATIYLKRKKEKTENYLYGNSEVTN